MTGHCYSDASLPEFDAFGDPVSEDVARSLVFQAKSGAEDRNARSISAILFCSLVLALLAGRIYTYETPLLQTAAASVERVVSR